MEMVAIEEEDDKDCYLSFFNALGMAMTLGDQDFLLKRVTWFLVLMFLERIRCGLRINSEKCEGTQTGNLVFRESFSTYSLKLLCCRAGEQRTSQRMKWRGNMLDKLMK